MRMRQVGALSLGALVVGSLLQAPAWPQTGTTFTVTRFDDPVPDACNPGDCSLREAVIDANGALGVPTVVLPAGTFQLTQSAGDTDATRDLDVRADMTIAGAGADETVINAGGIGRAFEIQNQARATITGVTIGGGTDLGGGAIALLLNTQLTLSDSALIDNQSTSFGGAIRTDGGTVTTLTNVLVSNNRATGMLASSGGGILSSGTLTLTNVTLSGNLARFAGGGLFVNGGAASLNNVTVTDNLADSDNADGGDGGGVGQDFTSTLSVRNSIVAGNRVGTSGAGTDCSGTITSEGGNVFQDPSGCTLTPGPGDVTGQPAGLGALTDNGGPTATYAVLPGSPAQDRGGTGCAATDQRGAPRTGACDSGAYELVLCQTVLVNEVGTEGADVLTGTEGADGVLALGGNDKVSTLGGNDGVCGGSGNDTAGGGGGKDRLSGESGKDKLRGQGGADRLKGGPGKDLCVGGGGKDRAACETEKSV